jgi:hypothetical protein
MNKELVELDLTQIVTDFSADVELTPEVREARRARICALETALVSIPESYGMSEFNEGKITHHFATGVYGRELFIPKGNVIVSKIHRGKTFNIIAKGVISVISEQGYHTYEGPYTFVSEPFTKRVVIAHEDTLWITAHGTHQTDLDKVEEEIIAKDFKELKQGESL